MGTPGAWTRAVIAGAVGAFVLGCAAPALASPGAPLLPDLVTLRPNDLSITESKNHLQLRLANTVANRADATEDPAGPLEIFPGVPGTGEPGKDCDSDEQPAFQRIFKDSNDTGSADYFDRSVEGGSIKTETQVGCMAYHVSHQHFHFNDFALYELRRESNGKLAAKATDSAGRKVSFCVIDSVHAFDFLLGYTDDLFYGAQGCQCSGAFCEPEAIQGLSIGYGDVYVASTPGQRINIDGLPKGRYCLISTADPSDRLDESDDENNSKRRRILLHPRRLTLDRLHGPCKLGG